MRAAEKARPVIESVFVEEVFPECRLCARVPMRRDAVTGELSYAGKAMRTLDRLRAVVQDVTASSTPGNIALLRDALGMTQQQFATRLKVTSQTVSRWERGEVRPNEQSHQPAGKPLSRMRKTVLFGEAQSLPNIAFNQTLDGRCGTDRFCHGLKHMIC